MHWSVQRDSGLARVQARIIQPRVFLHVFIQRSSSDLRSRMLHDHGLYIFFPLTLSLAIIWEKSISKRPFDSVTLVSCFPFVLRSCRCGINHQSLTCVGSKKKNPIDVWKVGRDGAYLYLRANACSRISESLLPYTIQISSAWLINDSQFHFVIFAWACDGCGSNLSRLEALRSELTCPYSFAEAIVHNRIKIYNPAL
jgi:hypothetical protein